MSNETKIVKNWWLLTVAGVLMTLLGVWVYKNPVENYIGLSILFSIILFISGVFEIIFALTNTKTLKGWGWVLSSGIFDLIIGSILITREDITMEILPIIFGIWLIFRGVIQISRGILLKEAHFTNWWWSALGGLLIVIFGLLVVYDPAFGSTSIVIWTALSLVILGIFTILFSFLIKKLQHYLKT
ncbi:MAG: DUF308 domain-containing protein [Flavobacteriaceae bacterium]|nr:DUF308 domain-containing protein [Flavobacteriaceae bacterium]